MSNDEGNDIPPRRFTMLDVAERAHVSRTTVSLILNNRETRIPEATRERVKRIAAELGFRPSLAALQLRTQRSRLIALVADDMETSPHAGRVVAGASRAAADHGYSLIVVDSRAAGVVSGADRELLEDRQVDGIVFATMTPRERDVELSPTTVPRVILNGSTRDGAEHRVAPDDVGAGRAATQLLIDAGHRVIAFIASDSGGATARRRQQGFVSALAAAGLEARPELVVRGAGVVGFHATRDLLGMTDPPTALVVADDRIALGAYEAIRAAGLRIPDDISVVGHDDHGVAAHLHPALTTIDTPHEEMARRAVDALLSGGDVGVELVDCPAVLRESVSPRSL